MYAGHSPAPTDTVFHLSRSRLPRYVLNKDNVYVHALQRTNKEVHETIQIQRHGTFSICAENSCIVVIKVTLSHGVTMHSLT